MKIKSIREIEKPKETYNLHIKKNHNYVANGLVVSNCHGLRGSILRALLCDTEMAKIPIRWGLTGTVPKEPFEVINLTISIGDVIHKLPTIELQDKGILSHCDVKILQLIDTQVFSDYPAEYDFLVTDPERLSFIANLINEAAKTGNVLALVGRKETGRVLEKLIPDSIFLSGATDSKTRKGHYDEVKISNSKVIIATSGIASVGIDIPRINHLFLIESGKSFIKNIQSCGRSLRTAFDKNYALIWDICSSCKYSKRHLTARRRWYAEQSFPFKIEKIIWKE